MSGMSGFETAALVKQHPRSRHIPIIFITALSRDAENVFHGYSQGAVDYLLKPFEPEILRSKVSVFIDLYLKGETIKLQERLLRQREREALERRSQHRYRSLLDSMPQCVWAANADGEIYYWNRAGIDYCGLTAEQVGSESFWQAIHPDDRAGVSDAWMRRSRAAPRSRKSCACAAPADAGPIVGVIACRTTRCRPARRSGRSSRCGAVPVVDLAVGVGRPTHTGASNRAGCGSDAGCAAPAPRARAGAAGAPVA